MKGVSIKHIPTPILLLLLSIIIPKEISINIGGLYITMARLVLLYLAISLVFSPSLRIKKQIHDYALIGFVVWIFLSLLVNHGFNKAIENGGASALEILVTYFSVRYYVNKISHIYSLLNLIIIITMIFLPFLLIQNITGMNYIRVIAGSITGNPYSGINQIRLGLIRASGPFNHPILSGVFFSAILGLYWYGTIIPIKKKVWQSLMLVIATFTSLSSAPILIIGVQIFAISWNKIAASMKNRWRLVFMGIVAIYIFLLFYSDRSPLLAILSRITLDSATSYWRVYIWEYGTNNVIDNPIFGIGFHDWVRPSWMVTSSVDNFWLLRAMMYGLPALLLLGGSVYLLMKKVSYLKDVKHLSEYKMISVGWLVSMFALIFVGFTVDFFGSNRPYFFFLFGLGAAIFNMQKLADRKYKNSLNERHG